MTAVLMLEFLQQLFVPLVMDSQMVMPEPRHLETLLRYPACTLA